MKTLALAALLTLTGCSLTGDKADKVYKQWEPIFEKAGDKLKKNAKELTEAIGTQIGDNLEDFEMHIETTITFNRREGKPEEAQP